MTLARLLAAGLLVCSALAFSQTQSGSLAGPTQAAEASKSAAITSEPWRILPKQPAVAGPGKNSLDGLRTDDSKVFQFKPYGHAEILNPDVDAGVFFPSAKGQPEADTICYTMRSYVVARDAKDSDATHPAGYSTCQPSNRYQLKNAQGRTGSGER